MPLVDALRSTGLFRDSNRGVLHGQRQETPQNVPERPHRRITGYHNAAQDDLVVSAFDPPPYPQRRNSLQPSRRRDEELPEYTCTVFKAAVLEWKLEKNTPFEETEHQQWEEVYVQLKGTVLSLYNLKNPKLFGSGRKDNLQPGRRIKSYTMQHAEVGIASDHKKIELIPRTQLAQILPTSALSRLQETEPHLFEAVHYYVARLRLEGDQLLLRFKTAEDRTEWIQELCAAVDIAPPLEVRSEPRYHTLPRRRRRGHNRNEREQAVDPSSRTLIEEQERIARAHFPQLVRAHTAPGSIHSPTTPNIEEAREIPVQAEGDPEADDLDRDFMITEVLRPRRERDDANIAANGPRTEDVPSTRTSSRRRHHAQTGPSNTIDHHQLEALEDSSDEQKWNPGGVEIDSHREARYRRRCMPILVYNSRHAQEVIIRQGQAMQMDWEKRRLMPYQLAPPQYDECVMPKTNRTPRTRNGGHRPPFLNTSKLWRTHSQPSPPSLATAPLERTRQIYDQNGEASQRDNSASSADATGEGSVDDDQQNNGDSSPSKSNWSARIRKMKSRWTMGPEMRSPSDQTQEELDQHDFDREAVRESLRLADGEEYLLGPIAPQSAFSESPKDSPTLYSPGANDRALSRLGF